MLKELTIKVGAQSTRAQFVPSSFNEADNTIDVTFATDTPVLRYSWDGPFYEVLDMGGHQTNRSAGSLPVLNNHDRYSGVTGVIGRAENIRLVNGEWVATIRFSKREDVKPIIQDVQDGILQDTSVGYRVFKYEAKPMAEGEDIPTYIARQWESNEISFVTVPADQNAKVRSQQGEFTEVALINNQNQQKTQQTMTREEIIAALSKRGISVPDGTSDDELKRMLNSELEKPAAVPAATNPTNQPDTRAIAEAERSRIAAINEGVETAGLAPEVATRLINDGTPIDQARAEIFKLMREADGKNTTRSTQTIRMGAEQADKVRAGMENAIMHRVDPTVKLDELGQGFRGMGLMDMARFSLEQNGIKHYGMSKREVAMAAMGLAAPGSRGYHSTSDFPIVLGNTINRRLRRAYELQTRTFMPFCTQTTLADFRAVTRAQISGLLETFDAIPEGGEYKATTMTEGKESYKLVKYGRIIGLTWEALINDDLDAFGRIPTAFAAKAAQKQSDIVYGILTSNPNMGDGNALFSAAHGNIAGAGSAITSASLSAARQAMRIQKGLEGDFINVAAKYLVVGPAKETEAQQLLQAVIMATKTADTNVFRGSLELIVDPRITGNQWFLFADPSAIDTIEYAFLDGEPELFTEQRQGFNIDGMEVKARMVFAAKAIDWRGMYYNPGA